MHLEIRCAGDRVEDCARVERLDSSTGCSEVELTEAEDYLQTAEQSQLRNLRAFFGSTSL